MSSFTHLLPSKFSYLRRHFSARSSSTISDFNQFTSKRFNMNSSHKAYDEEQRMWIGPKYQPKFDLNTSIGRIIYDNLKATPDKIIEMHAGGEVLTNFDILTAATRLAQHFKKLGFTHEDIIGITSKSSKYVISLCVACFMNCTPYHGVNPVLDYGRLFGITKPKLIFCDGAIYAAVAKATKGLNTMIYTLTDHLPGVPSIEHLLEPTGTEKFYEPETLALGSHQTMAILSSSGTTGPSKPVCVSNMMLLKQTSAPRSEDLILGFSGVDWVSGVIATILSLLFNCRRILPKKPFTTEYFVELVKKYRPTQTFLTPFTSAAVARYPSAIPEHFTSLRHVLLGGGIITLATMNSLKAKMPNTYFSSSYGMTEAFHITANPGVVNGTSPGKVIPGNRIRIVDEHERNLGPNEVGEVLVDNGIKWQGYYGDPEGTKAMLDDAGWLHTGDMGYFDDNEYLYLVGRRNQTVTCYSIRFWPREIETVIHELPDVVDCCVVGIPSEICGEAPGALIIKENNCQLTADDIKKYVAKRLPEVAKHLHAGVVFVKQLPYNNNQKVIMSLAKELFLEKRFKKES